MNHFLKRLLNGMTLSGLTLLLMSCGGSENGTDAANDAANDAPIADTAPNELENDLDAAKLSQVLLKPVAKIAGNDINPATPYNASLLNATGEITYPEAGQVFTGNVTVKVAAEDIDGINRILLGIGDSNNLLVVCEENCGTSYAAMVNGISPYQFGQDTGEKLITLWVEDESENLSAVASVNINWQKNTITSVAATIDQLTDTMTITWAANNDVLRYNAYVATEPELAGANYLSLADGDAKLAITGTSTTLEQKLIENTYFVLVTGIDGTGESAFSDVLVLTGGVRSTQPVAVNDNVSVLEDSTLADNVLANDIIDDNDLDSIVTTLVVAPSNGQVDLNNSGSYVYTPNANFNGTDQFSYQISNDVGLSSQATVIIEVNPSNDAPIAQDDTFVLTSLPFALETNGVLQNDTDIDNTTLTVAIDPNNLPKFGTVQLFSDGTFVYTPNDNFVNYDSFGYITSDEISTSNNALVTLTTPDFNGYPPITIADQYQLNEDSLLIVTADNAITNNDFDEDDDIGSLVLSLVSTTSNGTLLLADDGTFTYQPNSNFFGIDSFQYRLTDDKENATIATVTLDVTAQNDSPNSLADAYTVTNQSTVVIHSSFGVLANDTDIDGDAITVDLTSISEPSFGQLTLTTNGSFEYTANAEFIGTDSFSYRATDGNLLGPITTVMLNVVTTIAATDDVTPIQIPLNTISEQFPNNATLVAVTPSSGSASFNQSTISYLPLDGFGGIDTLQLELVAAGETFFVSINVQVDRTNKAPTITSQSNLSVNENVNLQSTVGTVEVSDEADQIPQFSLVDETDTFEIDQFTGVITVKKPLNFELTSSYTVTVSVTDPFDLADEQLLNISVIDRAEAPVFTSTNNVSIDENTSAGTTIYTPVMTDEDRNATATFSLIPANDNFAVNASTGAITIINQNAIDFESSPQFNLTLRATDNTALSSDLALTITINNINETPFITNGSQITIAENTTNGTLIFTPIVEDGDLDSSFSFSLLQGNSTFGINPSTGAVSVIQQADLDFETTQQFDLVLQVTDNTSLSSQFTLTVNLTDVNEAPIFTSQATVNVDENSINGTAIYTSSVQDNDAGSSVSYALLQGGETFAIDSNTGVITVIEASALNFETTTQFDLILQATDNSNLTTDFNLTVTLENVNEAPAINGHTQLIEELLELTSPTEDTPFITFDAIDPDTEDTLTWSMVDLANFTIDATTGTISIVKDAHFDFETESSLTLNVTLSDAFGLFVTYDIELTVVDENEAPIAINDTAEVTNYSSINIPVLANDSDPEDDNLTISLANANNGSVEVIDGTSLQYAPNDNITNDQITYTITDTEGLEATATVEVSVTPLSFAGEHDINQDEQADVSVSYAINDDKWTVSVTAEIDTFFQVIADKYYPIEKAQDGTASLSLISDQSEHNFGFVLNGYLHFMTVPLLDNSATVQIDFDGQELTTSLAEDMLLGSFVDGMLTFNGTATYQRLAVNPITTAGATFTFAQDLNSKFGTYTYDGGEDSFTWQVQGSEIDLTISSAQSETATFTTQELLDLGVIDQATYDAYQISYGQLGQEVDVELNTETLKLNVVDNQYIYLDVQQSYEVSVALPSSLGAGTGSFSVAGEQYRLYHLDTLGTYAFSAIAGEFILPIFMAVDDTEQLSAARATFNSNGTGSLNDLNQTFSWSVNQNFELVIVLSNGTSYTLTKISDNPIANEVIVTATSIASQQSAIAYMVKQQDLSSFDLAALLDESSLMDSTSFTQLDSFDTDNLLQSQYINGYLWSNTAAQGAAANKTVTSQIISGEGSHELVHFASEIIDNTLLLNQYIDLDNDVLFCDPKANSSCYSLHERALVVHAYDSESGQLWVMDTQSTLDFESILQESPEPTYQVTEQQLKYFVITDKAQPTNDVATVAEEGSISDIDALSNDLNSDNNAGDLRIVTAKATTGLLSIDSEGALNYAAVLDFNGEDTIDYVVIDGTNHIGLATIAVSVTPVNDAPIAYADNITVNENDNISFDPTENDIDIDGDTLTVVSFTQPIFGTIVQNEFGDLTYAHDGSETIADTFTYTVSDGTESVVSTTVITILPINDAPITNDDSATVDESGTVTIPVKTNDSDAESSNSDLVVTISQDPIRGTATVNTDGTIEYLHNGEESASDTFVYTLSDGELSTIASVNITVNPVNDVPVANNDTASVVNYETVNINVLANDTDDDGNSLTLYSASALTGSVVIESDNTLTYTPIDNSTTDTISYSVFDGTAESNQASVLVTITPRPLGGDHDINADNVDDLTVTEVSMSETWQITVSDIDHLFKIENDRYYPFEADKDGQYDISISNSDQNIQLGAVIGETLHLIELQDLDSTAIITANRTGTALPKSLDNFSSEFSFISANITTPNGLRKDAVDVIPLTPSGDLLEFDRNDMSGNVISADGQYSTTWSANNEIITVAVENANTTSQYMQIAKLLDLELISQTEYDDFLANSGNQYQQFQVTLQLVSFELEITDNNAIYFNANQTDTYQYTLNAIDDFAGSQQNVAHTPYEVKLYDKATIGTYEFDDKTSQTWYFPYFQDSNDNQTSIPVEFAFSSDGENGDIFDFESSFAWQVNESGQLVLDLDIYADFENLTMTALSESSEHPVAFIEGTHASTGKQYAMLGHLVKSTDYNASTLNATLLNKKLVSGYSVHLPSSYDVDGQLLTNNMLAYGFGDTEAPIGTTGENIGYRDIGTTTSINRKDWTWRTDTSEVALKAYTNGDYESYIYCDTIQDNTCVHLRERTWQVLNIDVANNSVWVIESEVYLSLRPENNGGIATYNELVTPRLNQFYIVEEPQLQSEAVTISEDISETGIDVLANDLDSLGQSSDLRLLNITANYGTVTINNNAIDYSPDLDFNGTDTVTYVVADEYNKYAFSTLEVTVNSINDAPTITSSPNIDATIEIDYEYYITIEDPDDFGRETEFNWSILDGPANMTVSSSGNITWTPPDGTPSVVDVTIAVADGGEDGAVAATQTFTIDVASNPMIDTLTFADSTISDCFNDTYDTANTRVLQVTYFGCNDVATLDDLVQFTNIEHIDISNSADWSALANLDLLGFGVHNATNLTDWSLLTANTNLTSLTVYNVAPADWSFLTNLDLTYLNVSDSNFDDLSLISHMNDLDILLVNSTAISDWSTLTNFNLSIFSGGDTTFSDLNLLSSMTGLSQLHLYSTNVTDWSLLPNFDLEAISVSNTGFSDLSLLAGMSGLVVLDMHSTAVNDFSTLSNFQLTYLSLADTSFDNLDFNHLTNSQTTLTELDISATNVTDLSSLTSMTSLTTLRANILDLEVPANTVLLNLYNAGIDIQNAADVDENEIFDFLEDPDGDGLINSVDMDDDGDETPDESDAYPFDPNQYLPEDLAHVVEFSDSFMASAFTNSAASWFEQSVESTVGGTSLQSGVVGPNEFSTLLTEVDAGADGATLTFDWKVSSEANNDVLSLLVDGEVVATISGATSWTSYSYSLPEGLQEVSWRYSKNGGETSEGSDAGWLDNVALTLLDINDAPVASNGSAMLLEDNSVIIDLLSNASDEESYPYELAVASIGTASHGTIVNNEDGTVTYTHDGTTSIADQFTFTLTDGEATSNEATITIVITPVNDNPQVVINNTYSIAEGQTNVATASATDEENDDVIFSLSGTDADLLTIDANTGVITFNALPSFESPLDYDANGIYEVTVVATEANEGALTSSKNVGITITDINEHPVITTNSAVALAENITSVVTVTASDEDGNDISYSLSGADAALFNIDANTGDITFAAAPNFENPLDSDTDNVFEISVTATDNGAGNLTDVENFTITLSDVNEAPVFTTSETVSIAENLTAITTINAIDEDGDDITYTLSGVDNSLFSIDSNTGALSFTSAPNFELPLDTGSNNVYELIIVATEAIESSLSTTQNLEITISNIEEQPIISTATTITLAENIANVVTVAATDDDGDDITYSVTGSDAALFSINATTGELSFNAAPDFDSPLDVGNDNQYDITIVATDDSASNLSDTENFTITLTNVNEVPEFTTTNIINIAENVTNVLDIDVVDQDGDAIVYTIAGDDASLFTINATSGQLSFASAVNFESPLDLGGDNVYNIEVTATEQTEDLYYVSQLLEITVTDVNDSPVFTTANSAVLIENTLSIMDVDATDEDGNTLTYSLSGADAAAFSIDPMTGVLTFASLPNFELPTDTGADNVYNFEVIATDNGTGTLSGSMSMTVTVNNESEAPVITSTNAISIGESDEYGVILDIDATDDDIGDALTYNITDAGADSESFSIDTVTGEITFTHSINFEAPSDVDSDNIFTIEVEVTDSNELSATQTINITIVNVAETPLITTSPLVTIAENTLAVVDVNATDDDGDNVSFALSGDDANLFSINSTTGVVTFLVAPNFESPLDTGADGDYVFTVTATDDSSQLLSMDLEFVVSVSDINEAAYFTSASNISVLENLSDAIAITAVDPESDTLTYSVDNQLGDFSHFSIDSATGTLTVIDILDLEEILFGGGDDIYEITIHVQEAGGGLVTTQTLTVNILDEIENTELQLLSTFDEDGLQEFNTFAEGERTSISKGDFLVDAIIDELGMTYMLVRSDDTYSISRLFNDGTFDPSFGNDGRKYINYESLYDKNVDDFDDVNTIQKLKLSKLVVSRDSSTDDYDKVYVIGSQMSDGDDMPVVLRLNSDGSLDDTFSADGKFEKDVQATAIDLLVYSDTEKYLAVNSDDNTFILIALNDAGVEVTSHEYDLTGNERNEYIHGIIKDDNDDIVVVGWVENSSSNDIILARLDRMDINNGTVDLVVTHDAGVTSNDKVTSYVQTGGNTIVIGGSTGNDNLLAKFDLTDLSIDTSFATLGIYTHSFVASGDESVISLATNYNGDISYTSFIDVSPFKTYVSQVDATGTQSLTGITLSTLDLTETSDVGIANEDDIKSIVLHDQYDTTNEIKIISSFEDLTNQNDTEVGTYVKQYNSSASLLMVNEYEFQYVDSMSVADAIMTSDGKLLTMTVRDNENHAQFGYSIHKHNQVSGAWVQSFGTQGAIQKDANRQTNLNAYAVGMVELSDSSYVVASVIDENNAWSIQFDQYTSIGLEKTDSGFPVTINYSNDVYLNKLVYNDTVGQIVAVGHDDSGGTADSLVIKLDTAGNILFNNTFNVLNENKFDGLTDAILKDDGTLYAVGYGEYQSRSKDDGFVIKLNNAGDIDTNFDGNNADSVHAILVTFDTSDSVDIVTKRLVELSDGSLVIAANAVNGTFAGIMKLEDDNGQFAIDTGFDIGIDGTDTDNYLSIDLSPLDVFSYGTTTYINDMTVNEDDEVIMVGNIEIQGNSNAWYGKVNGLSGLLGSTLGAYSAPGFSIPTAYLGCTPNQGTDNPIDVCDVTSFDKIIQSTGESLYIFSTINSPEAESSDNINNTAILNVIEAQDDYVGPYALGSGS